MLDPECVMSQTELFERGLVVIEFAELCDRMLKWREMGELLCKLCRHTLPDNGYLEGSRKIPHWEAQLASDLPYEINPAQYGFKQCRSIHGDTCWRPHCPATAFGYYALSDLMKLRFLFPNRYGSPMEFCELIGILYYSTMRYNKHGVPHTKKPWGVLVGAESYFLTAGSPMAPSVMTERPGTIGRKADTWGDRRPVGRSFVMDDRWTSTLSWCLPR